MKTQIVVWQIAAWLCAVVLGAGAAHAGLPETFQGLGDLTHAGLGSEARAVSGDGSVVIGSSTTPAGQQAYYWTAATGMVGLATPTGQLWSWASGVSADGNWVVGYAGSSFGLAADWEGVRWNIATGAMDRFAVSGIGVWAKGISADGAVVVGTAGDEAFRWTSAGGLVGLGTLYESLPVSRSNAEAVSANGQVIVGDSVGIEGIGSYRDAFRWTEAEGMTGLGTFSAVAASTNGSVIVGTISPGAASDWEAYRWTEAGGIVPLGTFGPGHDSYAQGVSGDGSRVVGYFEDAGDGPQHAYFWDAEHGMRSVQDTLEGLGFDLTGWTLTQAWGVSNEGPTIVGRGMHNGVEEAFYAVLPEPATLGLLALGGIAALLRRRG
jgi:probable HAF family extracellular repeat protein